MVMLGWHDELLLGRKIGVGTVEGKYCLGCLSEVGRWELIICE